jgi:hypothetical protein
MCGRRGGAGILADQQYAATCGAGARLGFKVVDGWLVVYDMAGNQMCRTRGRAAVA